jgi:hypothetical protein
MKTMRVALYRSLVGIPVDIVLDVRDRSPTYLQVSEPLEIEFKLLPDIEERTKAMKLARLQAEIEKLRKEAEAA